MENNLEELTNLLDSGDFADDDICKEKTCLDVSKSEEICQPANKSFDRSILQGKSEIYASDTDSSDDEDNEYVAEQKFTETGRSIKQNLKKTTKPSNFIYAQNLSWKNKFPPSQPQQSSPPIDKSISKDIYSDPFFGMRIVTPLISSQSFKERMSGKVAITMNKLESYLQTQDKTKDWVLAGVIVSKYIKTSRKGNQFVCWTLSDLSEGLKTVSVFLFGKAYKVLWKTCTHVVVAILNPTPLDNRQGSGDVAALSVLNSDQVMVWGQSKDLGVCRAQKKNGEPCTSFVNKNQCEYCVYHVKQEYKKLSLGRAELQASWGGGLNNDLRNKVLGKNEVFYAGRSFTAVVAKPTRKQVTKDKTRLSQLFNNCESRLGFDSAVNTRPAPRASSNRVQLLKDAQRLQMLTGSPATVKSLELGSNMEDIPKSKQIPKISQVISKQVTTKLEEGKEKIPCINVKSLLTNSCFKSKLKETGKQSERKLQEKLESTVNSSKTPIDKPDSNQKFKTSDYPKGSQLNGSKKKPTKNRFDSLSQLKSKPSGNEKAMKTSKLTNESKSKDIFYVSFEFDESEDLILSNTLDKVENSLKNETNVSKDPIVHTTNKQSSQNHLSLGYKQTLYKLPNEPLHERYSATKQEPKMISALEKKTLNTEALFVGEKLYENGPGHVSVQKNLDLDLSNCPKLSQFVTLNLVRQSRGKLNALKFIKLNGPIKKEDPTNSKGKDCLGPENKKRKQSECEEKGDKTTLSQRFLDLMNTTSKHLDLISNAENEALDEYYDKMEKKEKMEEKILNTFKIDCKAFKCLKCKYKWFSPSELCKAENHPIKMVSAVKRFFQCQNCKNRTVSLEVIPLHNCSNCGSGNWHRAAMMMERKLTTSHLSIRGGEQKFTNSLITDTNLDLLVPDDM